MTLEIPAPSAAPITAAGRIRAADGRAMTMSLPRLDSSPGRTWRPTIPRPSRRAARALAGTVASCLGLLLSAGVTLGLVLGAF